MLKTCLLIIILLFVMWSIYNLYISEGFQNSGSESTSQQNSLCDQPVEMYKTVLTNYNKAVVDDNKINIDKLKPSLNAMKVFLTNMKCVLPTTTDN